MSKDRKQYNREQLFLITADGKSLALNNGKSRAVLEISGRGMAPMSLKTVSTTEGTRVQGYSWKPRVVKLVLSDGGGNMTDYYRLKELIVDRLRPNRGGAMTLRSMRPGATRDLVVYNKDGSPDFTNEWRREFGYVETLDLYAPDPFFYDPEIVSSAIDGAPGAGFGFPYGFPYGYGAGGFASKSITYTGTVETYPTLVITGPYTSLDIIHDTLNVTLSLRTALDAGQTLTVDLSGEVVTATDNLGADRITDLRDANVLGFYLGPVSTTIPNGINTFTLRGVATSVATTVTLQYYNRYVSL